MKIYNEEKYYRIMHTKQLVYTNQLKRLSKNAKRANFVIIYYSIALIVYSLSLILFKDYFDKNITEFCSLILSIIILIYSIINSNSRYSERVKIMENVLIRIKRLKRELGGLSYLQNENRKEAFLKIKEKYEALVEDVEYRDDLDFYNAVFTLCKRLGINPRTGKDCKTMGDLKALNLSDDCIAIYKDEVKGYIAEINWISQVYNIALRWFWHIILYILPVAIFVIILLINKLNV